MPFLKIYRVKKSYLPISHITYYAPCGALSADPVAAAWYGFTIYPVGLRLSDRGAAAWYGFTMCPVGLRLSDRGGCCLCIVLLPNVKTLLNLACGRILSFSPITIRAYTFYCLVGVSIRVNSICYPVPLPIPV